MRILAIDPGPQESAWLVYDTEAKRVCAFDMDENANVLYGFLPECTWTTAFKDYDHLAIEMVESFGMAVGKEVFETVFWIGRFVEAWGQAYTRIGRKEVKLNLCGNCRAKDANIRQSLLDRFGGKEKAIGCKRSPGPLYGVRSHLWSALAVAVTFAETRKP